MSKGTTRHAGNVGGGNPDMPFQVSSVSKPMFALTLLRYMDKGLIDLDADISGVVSEFVKKKLLIVQKEGKTLVDCSSRIFAISTGIFYHPVILTLDRSEPDQVTYSRRLSHSDRGGGFSLKCSHEHSINELSPCAPRFCIVFRYPVIIRIPSFRIFTAALISRSCSAPQ